MNITVITEPPFEPVSLTDVYDQLRLDPDEDNGESPAVYTHPLDDMLTRQIKSARQWVEQETRRSLILQTLRLSMPDWPATCYTHARALDKFAVRSVRLYRPPVVRVESVKYFDAANALQTVSAADYYITDEQVPELRFVSTFAYPTLYERPDAVRVEYVAGYDPAGSPPTDQDDYASAVPELLKDAVLVGVQLLQTSTSPQDAEQLTRMRDSLISTYKVLHV